MLRPSLGALIYLRCITEDNEIFSSLIISKSKVSPTKQQSIPRLELCGALLLSKLIKLVEKSIRHHIFQNNEIFLWCDSQTVHHWLNGSSSKWKPFITSRINKICENTNSDQWRFVSTKDNPADLVSRVFLLSNSNQSDFWFQGPLWLKTPEDKWLQFDNKNI